MPECDDDTDGTSPRAQIQLLQTVETQEARIRELEKKYSRLKKRALYLAAPYALLLSPVILPVYLYKRYRKGRAFSANPRVAQGKTLVEISGRRADVAPSVPNPAAQAEMASRPDTYVLYRIVGNDLVPRHAKGQSYSNVEFILHHEPQFPNCEKRWVLNRIFDEEARAQIKALLDAHGQVYSEIPFSWDEFADIPYDFSHFPDGFFLGGAFESLDDDEKVRAKVQSYRLKNNYVMNNNGARNFAIEEGRHVAKWVLPWDGNCFVTAEAWDEISAAVRSKHDLRYLTVPMARITNNDHLLVEDFRPEAKEEPQIIFRSDAPERFDVRHVYGRRPKVELLLRLGVEGPWERWRLDPWDEPPRKVSAEAHCVGEAGWVARLFSGAASGELSTMRSFKRRGRLREEAIIRTIDYVDELGLKIGGYTTDGCLFYDRTAVEGAAESCGRSWVDAVLARADEALRRGLYSVLDKTTLPPSGDAHDYWHPAPYWWPDPKRRDGLPYLKKDGERVPGTEVFGPGSEKYDRTRLQYLFDDVTFLSAAWVMTQDDRYRAQALALVDTWFVDPATRMTPSLAYAQVRMGHDGNRGQSWGLIESKDMYYFLDAVRLLGAAEEIEGLRRWVGRFLNWMLTSPQGTTERRASNNHGTCYDLQVAALAAFSGDTATLVETFHRAQSRVAGQFREDGYQPEEMRRTLTQHYCAFNLQSWINLFAVFERLGFRPWQAPEAARIGRAAVWLLEQSEAGWRHKQIAPFDARRLGPIRSFAHRQGLVEATDGEPLTATPMVFHPDDGIAPLWELAVPGAAKGNIPASG